MPINIPRSAAEVEEAVAQYGAAPGGKVLLRGEARAAEEAAQSGVYITSRGRGGIECSRVGSTSRCFCGHALGSHKQAWHFAQH